MDFSLYLKALFALLFVIGLIGITHLVLKKLQGKTLSLGTKEHKRLAVAELITLDTKRRLVLVKRDDVEHLLLLGPHSDLVVEPHIKPQAVVK